MKRKHGGNIYQIARQTGIRVEEIIDFSANINPLGFSQRVKKIFASIDDEIINYPDMNSFDFIQELSTFHNIPEGNFIAGNGSTEFIHLFPGIIRPKSVLMITPVFTEYESSYQRAKGVVFNFVAHEKDHFNVQVDKLLDELKRGYSALYICNPANPTGTLIKAQTMREIVNYAYKKGTNLIIDETFMDFHEDHSMKTLVKDFDNLFVLRSMTKFFALAGLRNGYLITHQKNIEKIREMQEPWSINAVAQRAGIESLKDAAYIHKTIKYIEEARSAFVKELKSISSLTVFNSTVNFLLIHLNENAGISAVNLYEKLLEKGIIIRTCEDFQGLNERFFRVAIKKKNENKKFISELRKILTAA